MCKRFALDLDWNAIAAQFSVAEEDVRGDVLPPPLVQHRPNAEHRRHRAGQRRASTPDRRILVADSQLEFWQDPALPHLQRAGGIRSRQIHLRGIDPLPAHDHSGVGVLRVEGAAPVLFQPGDGIDGACDGRAVFVAAAFRGIPMAADGDNSHVPCGGWAGDGA